MQYDTLNVLLFFLIYGFSGFLLETVFRSITERRVFISRGFLTNNFCPLYGVCGMVIIQIFNSCEIIINNRLASLLIADIGSILAVTFLEYSSGSTLDRVFHHKMWDYSDLPFNLHSYICLDFSLMWGIVAMILANIIHPVIEVTVFALPYTIKLTSIYLIFSMLFISVSYNMRKFYHLGTIKL
ncbi:MAG: putative ABC transporter permease [Sedimentibacter sp.]